MQLPRLNLEIGSHRRCDNDGRLYSVRKKDQRFCCENCRKQFHKQGSPFLKLREKIEQEVARAVEECERRVYMTLDPAQKQRYRTYWPTRATKFDALAKHSAAAS